MLTIKNMATIQNFFHAGIHLKTDNQERIGVIINEITETHHTSALL
jgi:Zn-dependent oligopeptidase